MTKNKTRTQKPIVKYAGFWPRLFAILFDNLVIFLPLTQLFHLLVYDKTTNIIYCVLTSLFPWAYCIVFLGLWGQTLGMILLKIHVQKLSLAPIGWKEALLRYVVNVLISVIFLGVQVYLLIGIEAGEFTGKGFGQLVLGIERLSPAFKTMNRLTLWVLNIWTFSEVVVLLMNKKKRAIHDFIAGTVVVRG